MECPAAPVQAVWPQPAGIKKTLKARVIRLRPVVIELANGTNYLRMVKGCG